MNTTNKTALSDANPTIEAFRVRIEQTAHDFATSEFAPSNFQMSLDEGRALLRVLDQLTMFLAREQSRSEWAECQMSLKQKAVDVLEAAKADTPFGYVNTATGQFFRDVEECRKGNEGHWRTVYLSGDAPTSQPEGFSKDWCMKMAEVEAAARDPEISVVPVSEAAPSEPIEKTRANFEWWYTTRSVFAPLGTRESSVAWAAWVASGGYKAPDDWKVAPMESWGLSDANGAGNDDLHKFLDAAAGEGLVLGGVDAADLYIATFPERYAATPAQAAPSATAEAYQRQKATLVRDVRDTYIEVLESGLQAAPSDMDEAWPKVGMTDEQMSVYLTSKRIEQLSRVHPMALVRGLARLAATPVATHKAEPDMRAICEALGFDPTNHHNAAKCPYCRGQSAAPGVCRECGCHNAYHSPLCTTAAIATSGRKEG